MLDQKSLVDLTQAIKAKVEENRESIIAFLREIVAIPSLENQIGEVGNRVAEEMERLGYDEIRFDRMGNILGRIGSGPQILLYDSHLDTVGIGDPSAWLWDPFKGKIENDILYGRGACDEKGSTPGMVYALALIRELGIGEGFTFYYFGNMEEWCEGIAPQALVEVEGIRPDYVVIGEPTNMKIYRGQRGRIELKCVTKGRSCHASMPHLGENAIYKMIPFIQSVEALNDRLPEDAFLGKGSVVVSQIECQTPSVNAVPDECAIYIDRRLTFGETKETALAQIRALPGAEHVDVQEICYNEPSYTGFVFEVDKYFPAWALDETHELVKAAKATYEALWSQPASVGRWSFSTNGIYWMGKAGIPSIGFAPGDEAYAHTALEHVRLEDVVRAAEFYALLPVLLRG